MILWLSACLLTGTLGYGAGRAAHIKSKSEVDALIRKSIADIGRVFADHVHKLKQESAP